MVERRLLITMLASLLPQYASASENNVGAFQTGSYRKPYVRTYGLTHTQCHHECAYRHSCSAYTYKRQFKRCDWFPLEITLVPLSTKEEGVVLQEMTTEVRQKVKGSCSRTDCNSYEKCKRSESGPHCYVTECPPFGLGPNQKLGSRFNYIGAKIRVSCIDSSQIRSAATHIIECLKTGSWTTLPDGFCEISTISTSPSTGAVSPISPVSPVSPTITDSPNTTESQPEPSPCDIGWEYYNGHCYLFYDDAHLSWTDARVNCEKRNAILTDVLTMEEHNFIVSILQSSSDWIEATFWAGGSYQPPWQWNYGANIDLRFWHETIQIASVDKCLGYQQHFGNWAWSMVHCNTATYSICKDSILEVPGTSTGGVTTGASTISTTPPVSELCSAPWLYFGGSCYYFVPQLLTWEDAQTSCEQQQSLLVSIANDEENVFITESIDSLDRFPGKENLARDRPTEQSSTQGILFSSLAVDGKYSSVAGESQFCSETLEQDSPWWTVELDIETTIHRVVIKNRQTDGHRLQNIQVLVGPNHASFSNVCGSFIGPAADGDLVIILCNDLIVGKVIRIVKEGVGVLSMCEVEVFEVVQYSSSVNLALAGYASQSSTQDGMSANNTINGFYSPALQDCDFSCSQTQVEDDPWWHVNLDRQYPILEIRIETNVQCYMGPLQNIQVYVDSNFCGESPGPQSNDELLLIRCATPTVGQQVTIKSSTAEKLVLCNVEIYADPNFLATTWMGARLVNEFWSWEDGSILENGYNNWAPKYPDFTIGHCGRIQTVEDSLSWTNTDCSSLAYSVCEKGIMTNTDGSSEEKNGDGSGDDGSGDN